MHNARRVLRLPGRRRRRRHPGPDPPAPPGRQLQPSDLLRILSLSPYYPATLGGSLTDCAGCGRTIHVGETVWWPDNHQHVQHPLCYECGGGLAVFTGARTRPDVDRISPFAGGVPAFTPLAP